MSDQITQSVEFLEQATNVHSIASSATPSVNADQFGALKITALADVVTGVSVTGTPVDLQELVVRILDAGVAKAITWGSQFEAVGAALPTTSVAGKRTTVRFVYDATTSKWGAISVATAPQAAPTLASMTPNTALADVGGDAFTLVGTFFFGTTAVTIGGVAATSIHVVDDKHLTAVTPANTTGAYNVVVTTPGGTATLVNGATYA